MNVRREGPSHIYTSVWFSAPDYAGMNSAFSCAVRAASLNGDKTDTPQGKTQLCA